MRIHRLQFKLSGYQRGSGEYVYAPADSKARIPNLHTLDVTELAVRLVEQPVRPVEFYPEPWSWSAWGGVNLKPDAYIKIGKRHFFLELDRSTEGRGRTLRADERLPAGVLRHGRWIIPARVVRLPFAGTGQIHTA